MSFDTLLVSAGGDSSTTLYDAEIHSYNNYLKVYRSDVGGSSLMTSTTSVKTAMLIRLSKKQMYVTNYEGFNYYKQDKGLFAFDAMYMGLNRVVGNIYGSPSMRSHWPRSVLRVYLLSERHRQRSARTDCRETSSRRFCSPSLSVL